jgi:hypothetical protein
LIGLQARHGEWLGILGGWYEADRVTVFCQMNNDLEHVADSLSVVLRGYLVESLIEENIRSLFFWDGAGGPLGRYCHRIPTDALYLDRPGLGWRIFRSLYTLVGRFLPPNTAREMDWVAAPRAAQGTRPEADRKVDLAAAGMPLAREGRQN